MDTRRRAIFRSLLVVMLALAVAWPADADARRRRPQKPAEPEVQAPGTVVIYSTTTGAKVEIDDRPAGVLPLEEGLAVEPGQHTIKVHLRGWTEHLDTFTVDPGAEIELEIDLIPIAGIVKIGTMMPGATVKIDGKVVGVTPFDADVPVGKVTIAVSAPGYFEDVQQLDVAAGQAYDLKVDLRAMPTARGDEQETAVYEEWWFWTIIGVVVAGGAATAIALTVDTEPAESLTPHDTITLPLGAGF